VNCSLIHQAFFSGLTVLVIAFSTSKAFGQDSLSHTLSTKPVIFLEARVLPTYFYNDVRLGVSIKRKKFEQVLSASSRHTNLGRTWGRSLSFATTSNSNFHLKGNYYIPIWIRARKSNLSYGPNYDDYGSYHSAQQMVLLSVGSGIGVMRPFRPHITFRFEIGLGVMQIFSNRTAENTRFPEPPNLLNLSSGPSTFSDTEADWNPEITIPTIRYSLTLLFHR